MLSTLLESRAVKARRTGGGLVSVAVHAAAIGALVVVTARVPETVKEELIVEPIRMTELEKPKPEPAPPSEPSAPRVATTEAPPLGAPALIPPVDIPDVIPPIDLSRPVTDPNDFATGRRGVPASQGGVPGGTGLVPNDGGYFYEGQVSKAAMMLPGQSGPIFPEMLRTAGIMGQVLAQFVVDTTGRADLATFKALQSDHELFTAAVKASLARARYLPAEIDGRRVPQLVQQVFQFTLNR